MNVAFVHEWLIRPAGSEAVVAAAMDSWPTAPVHTLLYNPKAFAATPFAARNVKTSFLQQMPGAVRHHQLYLPIMPFAIEQFDLRGYDLVISSNHAVAKGVLTGSEQLHISYVHTPMRYAWDLYQSYLEQAKLGYGPRGLMARYMLHRIRQWDLAAATRVDRFIANSRYVARRIGNIYRRRAAVIYPPVEVDFFNRHLLTERSDEYVTVSRLVGYKRIPLIAEAFAKLDRPLLIIGDGPDARKVQRWVGGKVRWRGSEEKDVVAEHLGRCRAFVFAADEDFGIAPVEAQAAGAPVIALGRGGVLETVRDGITGLFYDQPTVQSIMDAVRRFEAEQDRFRPHVIADHARQFSTRRFQDEFSQFVDQQWQSFQRRRGH